MNDRMRRKLRAGSYMENRKDFREGVDGQPEPKHLPLATQPCSEFVQLQMWELELAEGAVVQDLCMFASTSQPGDDGGLSKAEDPLGRGWVEPFGQRREHPCDLLRRSFQTVQRCVASSAERDAARRTSEGLDALGLAMVAVSHQSMDGSVCDPEVGALLVGTSEACGVYSLGCSRRLFTSLHGRDFRRGRVHT